VHDASRRVKLTAPSPTDAGLAAVFPGTSEMAARCRAFDWASTALGPVPRWSASLRTAVAIVLTSRQPMFLWWGPELVQVYNDAYRPSLGVGGRAERALGARGREFWTDIWDTIGPQIDQVMGGGEATWHEDQYLPIERNGRLEDVWWTYSYSPVRDDDGRIAATLVVCQETTARVRAERELEQAYATLAAERARLGEIVDRAPAFIAVLRGPEHRFERFNAEYQTLIGGRARIGATVKEVLPEASEQGFVALLDRVLETGEPFIARGLPVTINRTPGAPPEVRHMDLLYQALTEADGSRSGVFVHGVDVTEAVVARREAEAANRAKAEFLATMSHELRTPLNAIGGYAELLEMGIRGPVTPQQVEALRRVQASQRHLLGLINEVLNYAKLETGTVHYDFADVRLRGALADAEALVAPQAQAKGLALVVTPCSPALAVRADGEKLRQVLVNLLSNAIKFTDRGGRVELTCVDDPERVRVVVRDTGIGIAPEQQDRIFEPFVQVRADLTRTAEGTGLGLAISRDLARGMGGDLTVESTLDVGSAFTLTLPLAAGAG
jgi:signal transduction histidine kinase